MNWLKRETFNNSPTCPQIDVEHKNPAVFVRNVNIVPVSSFSVHNHSTRLETLKLKPDVILLAIVSWLVVIYGDVR